MDTSDRGQVNRSAAEIYDEFFVPALFQQWAARVSDKARIQPKQHILDVACGTGVLTRAIAKRVGLEGSVIGLDINAEMLAVAEKKAPAIDWKQGAAEALPFDSDHFDAVVSQFGLMFFEDRQLAIHEMIRVLKPQGHLAIAVWDSLENTPGYLAMVNLLQQLFGKKAADGLRAPYNLGDVQKLRSLFDAVGIANAQIDTLDGTVQFPSLESWIYTDIKGWVLADMLDDDDIARLLNAAQQALASFVGADGSVTFASPAHIVSVVKA